MQFLTRHYHPLAFPGDPVHGHYVPLKDWPPTGTRVATSPSPPSMASTQRVRMSRVTEGRKIFGHRSKQVGPSQPKPEKWYNNKPTERKMDKSSKPKMSQEEREQHKTKGLCFVCHKSRHFSWNCPERNKVPSTWNKPPSVASFRIDVNFGDAENQRELSAHSQECGLMVNNINIPCERVHRHCQQMGRYLEQLEGNEAQDQI